MDYKPINLIGMASAHMEDYRMYDGTVDIQPEDTGVIILIALYFIENDKKVSRTKLEAYLLMLDRICFKERGVLLFGWTLTHRRIRNFKAMIEFMLEKKLIKIKSRNYFELDTGSEKVISRFSMLVNIRKWLDEILRDYKDNTVEQALSVVLETKPTAQYIVALSNAKRAIDSRNSDIFKYKRN